MVTIQASSSAVMFTTAARHQSFSLHAKAVRSAGGRYQWTTARDGRCSRAGYLHGQPRVIVATHPGLRVRGVHGGRRSRQRAQCRRRPLRRRGLHREHRVPGHDDLAVFLDRGRMHTFGFDPHLRDAIGPRRCQRRGLERLRSGHGGEIREPEAGATTKRQALEENIFGSGS